MTPTPDSPRIAGIGVALARVGAVLVALSAVSLLVAGYVDIWTDVNLDRIYKTASLTMMAAVVAGLVGGMIATVAND